MRKIRVGLMGFGEIPRHIYRLCLNDDLIDIVAISEISVPEILHYLVNAEAKGGTNIKLDGNFLVTEKGKRTRIIRGIQPGDAPWDLFDVDFVVDGTWKYRTKKEMEKHVKAGAKKVILSGLPIDEIDRLVVMGVNEKSIKKNDQFISAGSATINGVANVLKALNESFGVDYAMLTTVHSYTSDQPLRDRASEEFRKSRSAAENIIPVETATPYWLGEILPEFKGRVDGSALNVPVPNGSLLDLTTFLNKSQVSKDDIHNVMEEYAEKRPDIFQVLYDPIVSTDVIDNRRSVLYDKEATMVTSGRIVKTLTWYHSALTIASRIIEVIHAYGKLETEGGEK